MLFAAGVITLLSGISMYAVAGLAQWEIDGLVAGGFALLCAFVLVEKRVEDPMLRLSLFRNRLFTGGTVARFPQLPRQGGGAPGARVLPARA